MKNQIFKFDAHGREILSKGAVAFTLQILGAGLAFFFQVTIARFLGASGSGVFFLSLTVATLIATISRLGMDNTVTRFVAAYASEKDWGKVRGVVGHAIRIAAATSVVASLTLLISADWLAILVFGKPELSTPLKLMSLAVFPLVVLTIYAKALQGLKRTRDSVLMQSVFIPFIASATMFVCAPMFGVSGAVLAYGIGVVITSFFGVWMWYHAKKVWGQASPSFSPKLLLDSSFPLLGVMVIDQVMFSLPLLILGIWVSASDVGLFGIAQRTAAIISLVLIAANIVVAPKFAELYHKRDMLNLEKVAQHGALMMTGMAIPVLLLFLIVPEWVMGLFGKEFSAGWLLLVIMSLGQLVIVGTGSVGFLLIMGGQERVLFVGTLWVLCINVFLSILLIPLYGATGAAVAATVTAVTTSLIRVGFVWKTMGIITIPFVRRLVRSR